VARREGRVSPQGEERGEGPPIVWEGSLGPNFFEKVVYEFPVKSNSDFTTENPLRGYNSRREGWLKYDKQTV
jgi:hypothetical protein